MTKTITVKNYRGQDENISLTGFVSRWTASINELIYLLPYQEVEALREKVTEAAKAKFNKVYEKENKDWKPHLEDSLVEG